MRRRVVFTGIAIALVMVLPTQVQADPPFPPAQADIDSAEETAGLLLNQLLAALIQQFSATTVNNVDEGNLALSLMFDDSHTNHRLVGTLEPLGSTAYPQDNFEQTALDLAMQGQNYTDVQRVNGRWFYRTSVALSNFDASCALCHTNFGPVDPTFWTGALMLKVPIARQVGNN